MKNEAGRDPDMGIIYKEIEAMLLEFEIIKINSEKNCFGYIYQNNRVFYLNFIFWDFPNKGLFIIDFFPMPPAKEKHHH